jgi:hypothetical protein
MVIGGMEDSSDGGTGLARDARRGWFSFFLFSCFLISARALHGCSVQQRSSLLSLWLGFGFSNTGGSTVLSFVLSLLVWLRQANTLYMYVLYCMTADEDETQDELGDGDRHDLFH